MNILEHSKQDKISNIIKYLSTEKTLKNSRNSAYQCHIENMLLDRWGYIDFRDEICWRQSGLLVTNFRGKEFRS